MSINVPYLENVDGNLHLKKAFILCPSTGAVQWNNIAEFSACAVVADNSAISLCIPMYI